MHPAQHHPVHWPGPARHWTTPSSNRGTARSSSNWAASHFTTKTVSRARVAAWIEEYNHDRRHTALGTRSPIDYELTLHVTDQEQAA
ncbi:hypothetical protein E0H73_42720 [Kribbella pittospori]|uniref:Integrase catalytic domain-containing protein n=1 Tax=Kribbella pittospori TaxID=722689 RepID=A0A4R0JMW0_9ACTN|nr:hypothetical protein E0H73_42720 [Kribbella pittospori]